MNPPWLRLHLIGLVIACPLWVVLGSLLALGISSASGMPGLDGVAGFFIVVVFGTGILGGILHLMVSSLIFVMVFLAFRKHLKNPKHIQTIILGLHLTSLAAILVAIYIW